MTITARQYQSLQAEACRMAEELPKGQLLDGLIAAYEAGRLLRMTKSTLIGLLGSVVLRCIDGEVDEAAPPVPPAAGMWPRVVPAAPTTSWATCRSGASTTTTGRGTRRSTGRGQEAWLLKQLYVERRFGRRNRKYSVRKKVGK